MIAPEAVHRELGRDALLVELRREYADLAAKRIRHDAPLFSSVEVA